MAVALKPVRPRSGVPRLISCSAYEAAEEALAERGLLGALILSKGNSQRLFTPPWLGSANDFAIGLYYLASLHQCSLVVRGLNNSRQMVADAQLSGAPVKPAMAGPMVGIPAACRACPTSIALSLVTVTLNRGIGCSFRFCFALELRLHITSSGQRETAGISWADASDLLLVSTFARSRNGNRQGSRSGCWTT